MQTALIVFWGVDDDQDDQQKARSLCAARIVIIFMWLLTAVLAVSLTVTHRSAQEHFYGPRPVSLVFSRPFLLHQTPAVLVLCQCSEEIQSRIGIPVALDCAGSDTHHVYRALLSVQGSETAGVYHVLVSFRHLFVSLSLRHAKIHFCIQHIGNPS